MLSFTIIISLSAAVKGQCQPPKDHTHTFTLSLSLSLTRAHPADSSSGDWYRGVCVCECVCVSGAMERINKETGELSASGEVETRKGVPSGHLGDADADADVNTDADLVQAVREGVSQLEQKAHLPAQQWEEQLLRLLPLFIQVGGCVCVCVCVCVCACDTSAAVEM